MALLICQTWNNPNPNTLCVCTVTGGPVGSSVLCLNWVALCGWFLSPICQLVRRASMCLAPASVNLAESRTPGLLSVILPPAEVLLMPGDKLERIEKEWKIGGVRLRKVQISWRKRICPRILCQNPLLTAKALLLNLAQQSLELSVILMTWQLLSVFVCAKACLSASLVVSCCVQTLCIWASVSKYKHWLKKKKTPYNQQASCVFARPIKSHSFTNEGPVEV